VQLRQQVKEAMDNVGSPVPHVQKEQGRERPNWAYPGCSGLGKNEDTKKGGGKQVWWGTPRKRPSLPARGADPGENFIFVGVEGGKNLKGKHECPLGRTKNYTLTGATKKGEKMKSQPCLVGGGQGGHAEEGIDRGGIIISKIKIKTLKNSS